MMPSGSDFLSHPINSFRQLTHVLRLTEMRKAEEIQEKRSRKADDVAKRTMYRKAHGLPVEQGLPWAKSEVAAPVQSQAHEEVDAAGSVEVPAEGSGKKKWLGIF